MASGYTVIQIRLHWVIAFLVLLQFASNSGMQGAMQALDQGKTPEISQFLLSNLHLLSGLAVFTLVLYRLYLRLRTRRNQGQRQIDASLDTSLGTSLDTSLDTSIGPEGAAQAEVAGNGRAPRNVVGIVALTVHWLFYGVLLLMPVTGMLTYYQVARVFGTLHSAGKWTLLLLLSVHIIAALYHLLWLRDGVFQRMLKPVEK